MIQIKTFGGLSIERGGARAETLGPRRSAFLAVLAAAGRRGVSRDRLLLYFWPDSTEERARHNLSQSVYSINKDLGQEVVEPAGHSLRLVDEGVESDVGR
ncbi:MAG: hypothetical protein AB7L66_14900, partial [Gemmatimonadales bacterium]